MGIFIVDTNCSFPKYGKIKCILSTTMNITKIALFLVLLSYYVDNFYTDRVIGDGRHQTILGIRVLPNLGTLLAGMIFYCNL